VRKKVVEDEDDEEEASELVGSPSQSSEFSSSLNINTIPERPGVKLSPMHASPPSASMATSPSISAQREAAQREKERLAIALGRAQVRYNNINNNC
jgi:hypothetical protein